MTTLEELEQKQQELIKQQNEIAKQIEELKENEKKKWQPLLGEYYSYIDSKGKALIAMRQNNGVTEWRICQGNCFESLEQAEQYRENLNTKSLLRALADELNGDEVIDWKENLPKYCLYYNQELGEVYTTRNSANRTQGVIYCLDRNFGEKAIQRIGEQRLIDLIKSGV
jgi:hypothetical protein